MSREPFIFQYNTDSLFLREQQLLTRSRNLSIIVQNGAEPNDALQRELSP
jgi:hypothetical protein